jgi:ribonuclease VapC
VNNIAVDTSAVIEIFLEGPQAEATRLALKASDLAFAIATVRVEAALVMMGRFAWDRASFDANWDRLGIEEVSVDSRLASAAIEAFSVWGRGRRTAGLNFGDCFSYALATSKNLPLLFVGNDFARADIAKA